MPTHTIDIWTPACNSDTDFFRRHYGNVGPAGMPETLGIGRVASPKPPSEKRSPLMRETELDTDDDADVEEEGEERESGASGSGPMSEDDEEEEVAGSGSGTPSDDEAGDEDDKVGVGALPLPSIDAMGLAIDDAFEFGGLEKAKHKKRKGIVLKGNKWALVGGLSSKDTKKAASPLIFAIVNSDPELVACLLQLGASPTANNASQIAARNGNPRVVEALREGQLVRSLMIERKGSPFAPERLVRSSSRASLASREETRGSRSGQKKRSRQRHFDDLDAEWDSAASDGSSFVEEDALSPDSPAVPRWRKDLVVENESKRKDRQRSRQQDRDSKGVSPDEGSLY